MELDGYFCAYDGYLCTENVLQGVSYFIKNGTSNLPFLCWDMLPMDHPLKLWLLLYFQRLPDQINERNEKMKAEMLGMFKNVSWIATPALTYPQEHCASIKEG